MNVRTICLAILYGSDTTGYEIRKQSVEGEFSYFVDASYGSIYPALARLRDEGLVTVREETQAGKPSRKVYSITEAGRRELVASLQQAISPDVFRSSFLLVAVFARLLGPQRIRAAIDDYIRQLREELAQLEEICRNDPLHQTTEGDDDATRWAVDLGVHCISAKLAFVEANRGRLEAIAAHSPPAYAPTPSQAAE